MGILVLTPLILVWRRVRFPAFDPAKWIEAATLAMAVGATSALVFGGVTARPYSLFPLILWAGLRFGQLGATATALTVSAVAIWGLPTGSGHLVREQKPTGWPTCRYTSAASP